jgi:hypothetical protein
MRNRWTADAASSTADRLIYDRMRGQQLTVTYDPAGILRTGTG